MPSCPEIQVAIEGMIRVLVQVQTSTAPISSGPRPECSKASSAACSAISSMLCEVYRLDSMPVLWRISSALIGDQL